MLCTLCVLCGLGRTAGTHAVQGLWAVRPNGALELLLQSTVPMHSMIAQHHACPAVPLPRCPARRSFIGQGAGGKSSGVGMSQKEQKEVLAGFR